MEKPIVYLVCGFLGAGKTTFSKKQAQLTGAIHLNPDVVCMQRYSSFEYENNWEKCFSETLDFLWKEIERYVDNKQSVIFDVGFWSKESRIFAIKKVEQLGAEAVVYYVYAPDNVLLERIGNRKGAIAEHNVRNFYQIKQLFEEPNESENFIKIDNF